MTLWRSGLEPGGKFKGAEQTVHPRIADVTTTSYDTRIKPQHRPFVLSTTYIPYNSETTMFRATVTRSTISRSVVAARQLHSSPVVGKSMTEKVTQVVDKVNIFKVNISYFANGAFDR